MTSEELIKLRKSFVVFKERLEDIIRENSKVFDKMTGTGTLLENAYIIEEVSADEGYLHDATRKLNDVQDTFKKTLLAVEEKIGSLSVDIDLARDRELAEKLAAAGGANGNKM